MSKSEDDQKFMRKAIELGRRAGIDEQSGGVFGAIVVDKKGNVIGEGYNQVVKHNDPTWHGEMQAIREAGKKIGSPHLDGCTLYTTGEPCPMCLCAAYWAHLDRIVYGASVEDAKEYGDFDDKYYFEQINKKAKDREIPCEQCLRDEVVKVWKEFAALENPVHY
jgi:tRNA(Arg) A34 adenosine deaminase TadA